MSSNNKPSRSKSGKSRKPLGKLTPANRVEEIMLVSADLFRQRGYGATSIRDIGEAMGITSAALYYHFKNKEEVLLAVMRKGIEVVSKAVGEAIAIDEPVWNRVHAAMRAHLQISLTYQDYAAVLLHEFRHLSAEARKEMIKARDAYERLWDELLTEAQAAGAFRPGVEPRLLRLMIFGALNLVVNWYRPDGKHDPDKIADIYADIIGDGVLA